MLQTKLDQNLWRYGKALRVMEKEKIDNGKTWVINSLAYKNLYISSRTDSSSLCSWPMELLCRQRGTFYMPDVIHLPWKKRLCDTTKTNIHFVFSSYWTRLWCWSEQLSTNVSVQPESSWLERISSEKSFIRAVMCKTWINS